MSWAGEAKGRSLSEYLIHLPLGGQVYELMPVTGMLLASTIALIAGSLVSKPMSDATIEKFFPAEQA